MMRPALTNISQFERVMEEEFRYKELIPQIILDRSFHTFQVAVTTIAQRAIQVTRPQAFYIGVDGVDVVFIGNREVSIASGFPITGNNPLIIAMRQNSELWVIASSAATLFILDMGL